jgi:GT2 family glycosyltransferase
MDLSIVILNYHSKNLIQQLVKGITALHIPLQHEIIVVDNNSKDGIEAVLAEQHPSVIFVQSSENRGYAAGNNLGIAKAQGKYILILNPDIVVVNDAIQKLYAFMEAHPEVGIAGPKLTYPNHELQESCSRWPSILMPLYRRTWLKNTSRGKKWLQHYFYRDWDHNENREVDWLNGASLIIRKEALIKVGLLDERFFLYLEDTDWCRRFWESGYKVYYVADATMFHYHKRSSAESGLLQSLFRRSSRAHIVSFIKYLWKYRKKPIPHTT